jgi:hypothetical protein
MLAGGVIGCRAQRRKLKQGVAVGVEAERVQNGYRSREGTEAEWEQKQSGDDAS